MQQQEDFYCQLAGALTGTHDAAQCSARSSVPPLASILYTRVNKHIRHYTRRLLLYSTSIWTFFGVSQQLEDYASHKGNGGRQFQELFTEVCFQELGLPVL